MVDSTTLLAKWLLLCLFPIVASFAAASPVMMEDVTQIAPGQFYSPKASDLPAMPNVDYAMRGYNILRGNPLSIGLEADPGFGNPIFQTTYSAGRVTGDLRYQVPDGLSVYDKPICNIQFTSQNFANEKTYQDDLKNVVKVDFNGWGAAFTGSSQYKKISHHMVNESHVYVKADSACGVYEIVTDPYNPPEMTQGFVNAVKTLQDVANTDAYLEFVQVYGTHVLYTTHMGAKYVEQSELAKESKEDLEDHEIDIDLAASYSVMFHLGIDIPTDVDKKSIEMFDKETLTHEIISYGSRPPSSGDALSWTNTTFNEPLPISYGLIPIDHVITDVYLKRYGIDATYIRKNLQNYLKGYCEAQKHNLGINDCHGPRGGCAGGHDCHHNAHCTDVQIHHDGYTDTSYSCHCNDNYFGDGFTCSGWNIETTLVPDITAGDNFPGTWKDAALCPNQTYAYSFALKVEPWTFFNDNTALNGVKLYCQSLDGKISGDATSGIGPFGSWVGLKSCEHGFVDGFRFRSDVNPSVIDHIYATNVDVHCHDGEFLAGSGINQYGVWSSWDFCPATARVCGLQTKIQDYVGTGQDDGSMTNIRVKCCEI